MSSGSGKQQLIDHFKDVQQSNYVFVEKAKELVGQMDAKILFSNNNEVWVKFSWPGFGKGLIKHYTFDAQGRLAREEITMLGSLQPWQIYPMPFAHEEQSASSLKGVPQGSRLSIQGNVEELTQVGHLELGPVYHTKFENEIESEHPLRGVGAHQTVTWNLPASATSAPQVSVTQGQQQPSPWAEADFWAQQQQQQQRQGWFPGFDDFADVGAWLRSRRAKTARLPRTTRLPRQAPKEAIFCDSTENQVCPDKTPCREPAVQCIEPKKCVCP